MKFYRGSASAARSYVEADRSRVDDYYLAEGTGVATRYVAENPNAGENVGLPPVAIVTTSGHMDGDTYERWVAGYDVETGAAKGRLRADVHGLRFVEVVVNGPKTWSLAAALHPEIAEAYAAAQDRAAGEIIGWLAAHATTRVGPRGRQVQVPVERLEAAVVRHYTSRAGDPHHHLHLQINARVFAAGGWRGLHSVGVVESIEAINGIGHAAVACDPDFHQALANQGYHLDPATSEITRLAPYTGAFSARAGQITRNLDTYEAQWRQNNPAEEPGPKLQRAWDRRAWADARPDKVVPTNGTDLRARWVDELTELGFNPTTAARVASPAPAGTPVGHLDRDAVTDLVLFRLGARRSAWNAADIRGEVEQIIATAGIIATAAVRRELAEDLTTRAVEVCSPLLTRDDVPENVRALTSQRVLDVEADLTRRLSRMVESYGSSAYSPRAPAPGVEGLDPSQARAVHTACLTPLSVLEGAAGAGKTTTLTAIRDRLRQDHSRLVVVTPTLKAAHVATEQLDTPAFSAAWLIHQHGYRWDDDGHRTRQAPTAADGPNPQARLQLGDLLVIDEAGMLDQDTALALLTIAQEAGARVSFMGDRHQLPAVGRGGVLDHAIRWAPPGATMTLDTVHRFSDPGYARLTLAMRTGEDPGQVFDELLHRGQIRLYPTDVQRQHALTTGLTTGTSAQVTTGVDAGTGAPGRAPEGEVRVIAQTREQVAALNNAIRDHRTQFGLITSTTTLTTAAGTEIGVGDQIATRHNDRELGVANRDTWAITAIDQAGGLTIHGRHGTRTLPADYVNNHVELAYATTVHGAQGETVDHTHVLINDTTGAAATYVAMTRGRHTNTAHLVADDPDHARAQWIDVFNRNTADLGPRHAAERALDAIDRHGPARPVPARPVRPHPLPEPYRPSSVRARGPGR